MICSCKRATFKYDILGRLKTIRGTLLYYEFKNNRYLEQCCFTALISSLYTVKDIKWMTNSINVCIATQADTAPPVTKTLYLIEPYLQNDMDMYLSHIDQTTNKPKCEMVRYDKEFRITEFEIQRLLKQNNEMYKSLIEADKRASSVIYLYNALKHDKDIMLNQIELLKKNQPDCACDSEEVAPIKRIDSDEMLAIKKDLKMIKKDATDKIAKYQYELEIANKKIVDLQSNVDRLLGQIDCFKDTHQWS